MPAPRKYHTEAERLASKRAAQARYRASHREKLLVDAARYREENREALRAKGRQYVAENSEAVAANKAAWRAANPERAAAYGARWARENRDRVCGRAHRRRARIAGSEPDLTLDQWNEILDEFDNACAYCQVRDVPMEIEHVTPISRGGRHTKSNVVPACRSCNARKGAKTLLEFAALA